MKKIFILFAFLPLISSLFAQQVVTIIEPQSGDSSFYHLARINLNEFWAGGKYGVLKRIDTLGNVSSVDYPNMGLDILAIERVNNYIFMATTHATIYRYNIDNNSFIKKEFPQFKGKCFYNLIGLNDGNLLVSGGTNGIATGKKKIPRGFIAVIDPELNDVNIIWTSFRKFPWSVIEANNNEILGAYFNGLSSRIITTSNRIKWGRVHKVKGLIHEIAMLNNELWYSGSRSIRFRKDGIIGRLNQAVFHTILKDLGCVWAMDGFEGKIIATTCAGEIVVVDNQGRLSFHTIPKATSIYDVKRMSRTKYLLVGQGKGAFVVVFDEQ